MGADKLQGTCGVCLRLIQLRDDRPIRHGFSAVGVRHGQSGPCAGTQFPHLGISTEGTQWALDREHKHLERLRAALANLATNPDLTWHPTKYDVRGGRLDLSRPFVVKHGDAAPFAYRNDSPPSYAQLHDAKVAELEGQTYMAERAIAAYELVIGVVSAHHLRGLWYRAASSGERALSAVEWPPRAAPALIVSGDSRRSDRRTPADRWTGTRGCGAARTSCARPSAPCPRRRPDRRG